jgi:hypothetical protein
MVHNDNLSWGNRANDDFLPNEVKEAELILFGSHPSKQILGHVGDVVRITTFGTQSVAEELVE